jgi:putative ABC transport system substrate-binding protein
MKRREFIACLALAAISAYAARGQQRQKLKRIAIVNGTGTVAHLRGRALSRTFFEELRRHGFIEGENLVADWYSGERLIEHYPDLAREVVSTHPDLIFVPSGIPVALHFKSAEIAVVTVSGDPIANGLPEVFRHVAIPDR